MLANYPNLGPIRVYLLFNHPRARLEGKLWYALEITISIKIRTISNSLELGNQSN